MTLSTQAVLRALVDGHAEPQYGLELSSATGLPSGTLYPILARLEKLHWLDSVWEDIDPRVEGRPRRRYYQLSGDGLTFARVSLAEAGARRLRITTRVRPVAET